MLYLGIVASSLAVALMLMAQLRHRHRGRRAQAAHGWITQFVQTHYGRVDNLTIGCTSSSRPIVTQFKNIVTGLRHQVTFAKTKGPAAAAFQSEWRESLALITNGTSPLPASTSRRPLPH